MFYKRFYLWASILVAEPPRVYRRLQTLRGWSHEYDEEIFPGGAGTSCSVSH